MCTFCRGMSDFFYLARLDIWHTGGFHGNADSIQDDRHFICPYQSFYMTLSYIYLAQHTYLYKCFKNVVTIHGAF